MMTDSAPFCQDDLCQVKLQYCDIDETLIQTVAGYPHLYDKSLPAYRDAVIRETTWEEIGIALKVPGAYAKERWRTLRDKYVREKKAIQLKFRSVGVPSSHTLWDKYPLLTFLDRHIQDRQGRQRMSNLVCGPEVEATPSLEGPEPVEEPVVDTPSVAKSPPSSTRIRMKSSSLQLRNKRVGSLPPVDRAIVNMSSAIVQRLSSPSPCLPLPADELGSLLFWAYQSVNGKPQEVKQKFIRQVSELINTS